MKLIVKFNLVLLLVFLLGMLVTGYVSHELLQTNARAEIRENARILMDSALAVRKYTSEAEVNRLLRDAANGPLAGILGYTEEPLASCDFNHDPHSGVVDASQTRVAGRRLVKVLVWFDNEWGYANRMLDILRHWRGLLRRTQ